MLSPEGQIRTFVVYMGPPGTGKSGRMNFYQSFFPPEDVMSEPLHRMGEKFGGYPLEGKRINLCGDLPDETVPGKSVGFLKQITGNDAIFSEGKGKNGTLRRCKAKQVYGSNFPIRLSKPDPAFVERMVVIPLVKQIDKSLRDYDFYDRFKDERAAIAVLALQKYYQVKLRGYKFSGEDFVNKYLEATVTYDKNGKTDETSEMEAFIEEFFEVTGSKDDFVISSEVCDLYRKYCEANQLVGKTNNSQIMRLFNSIDSRLKSTNKRIGNITPKVVVGVKRKNVPDMDLVERELITATDSEHLGRKVKFLNDISSL